MHTNPGSGDQSFYATILMGIQHSLGELKGDVRGNRQALLETTAATNLRIDDMRKDLLSRIADAKPKPSPLGWIRHIPWDRTLLVLVTLMGTLGWVKPEWLKFLKMLAGS